MLIFSIQKFLHFFGADKEAVLNMTNFRCLLIQTPEEWPWIFQTSRPQRQPALNVGLRGVRRLSTIYVSAEWNCLVFGSVGGGHFCQVCMWSPLIFYELESQRSCCSGSLRCSCCGWCSTTTSSHSPCTFAWRCRSSWPASSSSGIASCTTLRGTRRPSATPQISTKNLVLSLTYSGDLGKSFVRLKKCFNISPLNILYDVKFKTKAC